MRSWRRLIGRRPAGPGSGVDEAQVATPARLFEEVQASSRTASAGPTGFEAVVLIGQTPLLRRVGRRTLAALESRVAGRAHLPPLDLDEAHALLASVRPALTIADDGLDRLYAAAGGNPRRLLRLADSLVVRRRPAKIEETTALPGSTLLPVRPPLRVEDGLIEVGWSPESEATATREAELIDSEFADQADSVEALPTDEPVEDHYAALQAWNEWARNQGRGTSSPQALPTSDTTEAETLEEADSALDLHPQLWGDSQQPFAPYSQLFGRARPAKDVE